MYNKDLYDDIERAERLNQLEPDGYWEEENDIVGLKPEQVKKMLARDNALHDASLQKYKEKHKQKEAEQNEVPDAPVTTKNPLAPVRNPDKANVTGEQFKRSLKDCYWKLKRGYIQKVKKRHPNVEILFGQFESDMYSQKIKVGSRAFVDALEKGFAGIKWNARVLGEGPVAVAQNQLVGGGSKKVTAANTQINSGVGAGCAENIKADVMTIQKALLDLGLLSESDFEQESAVVKSSPTPSVEQEKIGKTIEAITKFQEEVLHWQESDGNISGPGSATLANIHAEHMDSDYVQKRIAMYPALAAQREAIAGAQMQKKEAAQKVQEPMVEEVDTDTVLTEEPTGKIQISSGAGGKGAKSKKADVLVVQKIEDITVPFVIDGMENSMQALKHYFTGGGIAVSLGNNTIDALISSDEFQARHQRIITGKTTALSGNFSVNLEGSIFHIGRTNVDYSIHCVNGICTVTYDMFVRDGFWDPDYVDEYIMGRLFGESRFQPDGLGPNLERFGGTPFPYKPVRGTCKFPDPGY